MWVRILLPLQIRWLRTGVLLTGRDLPLPTVLCQQENNNGKNCNLRQGVLERADNESDLAHVHNRTADGAALEQRQHESEGQVAEIPSSCASWRTEAGFPCSLTTHFFSIPIKKPRLIRKDNIFVGHFHKKNANFVTLKKSPRTGRCLR